MLQEDAMWYKNDENKKNMGFIKRCNNPLNPKFHISFATSTWKSNMKTFPTRLLQGKIF